MAMACAAAAAVSSSAAFVSSSSRISPTSTSKSSLGYQPVQVRCSQAGEKDPRAVSRREVFSFATLSLLLVASEKAEARDIPLFGIKKKIEQAEKAVEGEVKELEKEGSALLKAGEKELSKEFLGVEKAVSSAVSDIESATPSVGGLSPALQAGGVAGAELVAVLIASSVVNGLVSVPSK